MPILCHLLLHDSIEQDNPKKLIITDKQWLESKMPKGFKFEIASKPILPRSRLQIKSNCLKVETRYYVLLTRSNQLLCRY